MIRGLGLRGATAVNVITMVGIGPLITIPLVLARLHGAVALWAWVVGAVVALCDGLVYAELASLYPRSGSTYVYLREAFGRDRWGRLLAFLFIWQFVLSTPLVASTGYIGFAHYAAYLWPVLGANPTVAGAVAAGVGLATLLLLLRPIRVVGSIGVGLAAVTIATLAALVAAALPHASAARAFAGDPHAGLGAALAAGLGPALVIALYDYSGYGQACAMADEVRDPARTLPRAIVLAVAGVASLYVALQLGVLGVIPWRELVPAAAGGPAPDAARYVAATLVERTWGLWPARALTVAILAVAFASTFGGLLGASRVPWAAAREGDFLPQFARLHPRGGYPAVSIAALGLLALPACFFTLDDVIGALTAGIVLVQGVAQIVALAALRARRVRAPFRMWAYPVPALVALGGWIAIFASTGAGPIAYGLATLAAGAAVFAWRARVAGRWPFAGAATALALAAALRLAAPVPAAADTLAAAVSAGAAADAAASPRAGWGNAAIVRRGGASVLELGGRPFLLYGAAFFYERIPRERWAGSMERLRATGINTLDLYVPWNWHELADGDFDFEGRTNPRRDLREVLRLARAGGFAIVLRPGPVVRNEWRNGGYPAWLLARPEYGMPAHDRLEGRYPPTATLQNAHSDDAAAAWLANPTHLRYARRWIERVLAECAPVADRVVAVALDDDQGAYIDNQTYPAPHLRAYLDLLRDVVRGATSPAELTFVNTYQMKVPASSPVWAMGNWYQSDAYALGEHDRAQLELSFGMLQTRPDQPLAASEFQAGWLQGPGEVRPRAADPSNTGLALATMVGMGVRGIVTFPAQDTLDPGGWEAPFANWFYAWDAAYALDGSATPRLAPTAGLGAVAALLGPQLAAAAPLEDAAILYLGGSHPPERTTNAAIAADADGLLETQRVCRAAGASCTALDPAAVSDAELARYPVLLVPGGADGAPVLPRVLARISLARADPRRRVLVAPTAGGLRRAIASLGRRFAVEGVPGGTFAPDRTGVLAGFLSVPNYASVALEIARATASDGRGGRIALPAIGVPAHRGLVVPVGVRLAALEPRFAPGDRLRSIACMPTAAAVDPPGAPGGRIRLTVDRGCALELRLGGRVVRYVAAADGAVDVTPRGVLRAAPDGSATGGVPAGDASGGFAAARVPGVPVGTGAATLGLPFPVPAPPAGTAAATLADVYRDGTADVVLDDGEVRVVVDPDAGGRSFLFQDERTGRSAFTAVGAMRDDVAIEPPLSSADRIARYTHQLPGGTAQRPYAVSDVRGGARASATLRYAMPDALPFGAAFERTVSIVPGERAVQVDEVATFAASPAPLEQGAPPTFAEPPTPVAPGTQRAVSVSSIGVGSPGDARVLLAPEPVALSPATSLDVAHGDALGLYDPVTGELATVAWRAGDVERAHAAATPDGDAILVRLTLAPRSVRMRYGYRTVASVAEARAALGRAAAEADAIEAGTGPAPHERR